MHVRTDKPVEVDEAPASSLLIIMALICVLVILFLCLFNHYRKRRREAFPNEVIMFPPSVVGANSEDERSIVVDSEVERSIPGEHEKLTIAGNVPATVCWDQLSEKWGFLKRYSYSVEQRSALSNYLLDPANWSISWQALLEIEAQAKKAFGLAYKTKSMWDIVQQVVKPACEEHGAPIALVLNGWKVARVEGFVTHCWAEPFAEFMSSLRTVYGTQFAKPNLFICAFTIFQGSFEDVQGALGDTINDAPFVKTLRCSSHFTVVRNSVQDLYRRGWCLIEFLYARKFELYPKGVRIAGPTAFASSAASVMDVEASVKADREKIMRAIFDIEPSVQRLDEQIAEFRAFDFTSDFV